MAALPQRVRRPALCAAPAGPGGRPWPHGGAGRRGARRTADGTTWAGLALLQLIHNILGIPAWCTLLIALRECSVGRARSRVDELVTYQTGREHVHTVGGSPTPNGQQCMCASFQTITPCRTEIQYSVAPSSEEEETKQEPNNTSRELHLCQQ